MSLVAILSGLPSAPAAVAEPSDGTVRWSDGKLSVQVERAPLGAVLSAVGRMTGVAIEGADGLDGVTTADFRDMPLEPAIRTLLRGTSYVLVNDTPDGAVNRVIVLRSGATRSHDQTPRGGDAEPRVEPALASIEDLIGRDRFAAEEALVAVADASHGAAGAAALDLLGHLGTESSVRAVLARAAGGDPGQRIAALKVAATIAPDEALPVLAAALEDRDATVKGLALELIAQSRSPDTLRFLRRALRDPDPAFRLTTIELLARRRDDDSLAAVREAVSEIDDAMRAIAEEVMTATIARD